MRDTTRLTRIFTVLGEPAPLPIVLEHALATISELFASDVVVLLRAQGDAADPTPLAAIGLPEEDPPVPYTPGEHLAAALRARSPVAVADARCDPRVDARLGALEAEAAAWLPVAAASGPGAAAVLVVARCHATPYARADLDLLAAMAYHIGVLLERAWAESRLREAQEQLLQAEKLALLGKLAGSVAHEVNNPLTAVRANLDCLRHNHPAFEALLAAAEEAAAVLGRQGTSDARAAAADLSRVLAPVKALAAETAEILAEMDASTNRIRQLVAGFNRLSLTHPGPHRDRVDVRALVAEALGTIPQEAGRPELVGGAAPALLAVVDRSALLTALTGLLRLPMAPRLRRRGEGRVTVRVEARGSRPQIVVDDPTLHLSEEERLRVFDPRFEEVEAPGGRTVRLSLEAALVHRLLRACGAELTTEGRGPLGLAVRVTLPAAP